MESKISKLPTKVILEEGFWILINELVKIPLLFKIWSLLLLIKDIGLNWLWNFPRFKTSPKTWISTPYFESADGFLTTDNGDFNWCESTEITFKSFSALSSRFVYKFYDIWRIFKCGSFAFNRFDCVVMLDVVSGEINVCRSNQRPLSFWSLLRSLNWVPGTLKKSWSFWLLNIQFWEDVWSYAVTRSFFFILKGDFLA